MRGRMARDLGERDGLLAALPAARSSSAASRRDWDSAGASRAVGLTMPAVFQRGPPEATLRALTTAGLAAAESGYANRMGERFTRITLRANELVGYRAAVIACSLAEERELCERLLGQIASLEVAGDRRRA